MRRILALVLSFIIALALAGCAGDEPGLSSDVVSDARGSVIIIGYVEALNSKSYYSYAPGKIKLLACELGDKVAKGAVVATYTDESNPADAKQMQIIAEYANSVVSALSVEPDQAIGAGTLICVVSDGDSLIARADVLENLIKNLSVGKSVTISLRSDKTKEYNGVVKKVDGVARLKDNGDVVIGVEFEIQNPGGDVKIGYSVDIKVDV